MKNGNGSFKTTTFCEYVVNYPFVVAPPHSAKTVLIPAVKTMLHLSQHYAVLKSIHCTSVNDCNVF